MLITNGFEVEQNVFNIHYKAYLLCAGLDQIWWKHVSEIKNHTATEG